MITAYTNEIKTAFASLWLKHGEQMPFDAAKEIMPLDTTRAWQLCEALVRDPFVLAEKKRLMAEGDPEDLLPSKNEYLKEILDHARVLRRTMHEDAHKYDTLYANMRGHVEKAAPNVAVQVNNTTVNKVLVVRDHGSDSEYATTLEGQQAALVADAEHDITN